jgi:AraC-like DNA-binding protein/ligand-binding sensor protein
MTGLTFSGGDDIFGVVQWVSYQEVAKLPLVLQYEETFRKATGVALKLSPPDAMPPCRVFGAKRNALCQLVTGHAADELCKRVRHRHHRRVCQTLTPQMGCCFAGLHRVMVPVVLDGQHVATWVTDRVFCRRPTRQDFRSVAHRLARLGFADRLPQIEATFFRGRVVAAEQFQAMLQLLVLFAQHLAEVASRAWIAPRPGEPQCVSRAKQFVQQRLGEPVTLRTVAAAANVSPYHFCRVFKTATGMKFSEYVARQRVARAKALLADRHTRVSEAAYAAGFGSIAQFNAVFRRYAGVSPSQFRRSVPTAKSQ